MGLVRGKGRRWLSQCTHTHTMHTRKTHTHTKHTHKAHTHTHTQNTHTRTHPLRTWRGRIPFAVASALRAARPACVQRPRPAAAAARQCPPWCSLALACSRDARCCGGEGSGEGSHGMHTGRHKGERRYRHRVSDDSRTPKPRTYTRTRQHNTTQDKTRQHNTTQHSTTQHNTTQHNTTQHNTRTPHAHPFTPPQPLGSYAASACCLSALR